MFKKKGYNLNLKFILNNYSLIYFSIITNSIKQMMNLPSDAMFDEMIIKNEMLGGQLKN